MQFFVFNVAIAIVLGAVLGSYLTCALYRCSRGQSLRRPPSRCPVCDKQLKAPDLIPVFSWVFTGGKCRHCASTIPASYPLTELYSVLLALLALYMNHTLGGAPVWFLLLYAALMSFSFAAAIFAKWRQVATKSVAFGLLCFGIYVALLAA